MIKQIRIAIDGPAAAGKSTVAKIVAKRLSFVYIDTGAMYRSITYKVLKSATDVKNEIALNTLLETTNITFEPGDSGQMVFVDGINVTDEIRQSEVTQNVSMIAAIPAVRAELVEQQQLFTKNGGVVMDGRDIGTHVIPDAELKIFLLASVEERAQRRHKENTEKGYPSDLEQLRKEIQERDKKDTEREVSPLRKADDAIEIDTTSLSIDEVADKILSLATDKIASHQ